MPKGTNGLAVAETAGFPSNTMTRSARYVAIMKSCSIIKAVFFAFRMNLLRTLVVPTRSSDIFNYRLMTLLAMIRCSESKNLINCSWAGVCTRMKALAYELGSSMRYSATLALPSQDISC